MLVNNDYPLPEDAIPGWKVYVHRDWYNDPQNFSRRMLYTATNGKVCLTRATEISESMLQYNNPKVFYYMDQQAIHELKEDAIRWALSNDDSILALKRMLDYNLQDM